MAIDSASKRASIIGYDFGGQRVWPIPDGSLATQVDRQHMAGKYAQVMTPPPPSTPGIGGPPGTFMPTGMLPNPVNA